MFISRTVPLYSRLQMILRREIIACLSFILDSLNSLSTWWSIIVCKTSFDNIDMILNFSSCFILLLLSISDITDMFLVFTMTGNEDQSLGVSPISLHLLQTNTTFFRSSYDTSSKIPSSISTGNLSMAISIFGVKIER